MSVGILGDSLLIAVEDEGPGVPLSQRELIFKPWVKLTDASVSGVGLGLAISLSVVQDMHGTIGCTDRLDGLRGARFWVRIPSSVCEDHSKCTEAKEEEAEERQVTKEKEGDQGVDPLGESPQPGPSPRRMAYGEDALQKLESQEQRVFECYPSSQTSATEAAGELVQHLHERGEGSDGAASAAERSISMWVSRQLEWMGLWGEKDRATMMARWFAIITILFFPTMILGGDYNMIKGQIINLAMLLLALRLPRQWKIIVMSLSLVQIISWSSYYSGAIYGPLKTALCIVPIFVCFIHPEFYFSLGFFFITAIVMAILNIESLSLDYIPTNSMYNFACDSAFASLAYIITLTFEKECQTSERVRAEFIGSVSHELRTPLHGALCAAELLLERKSLSEEDVENVKTIFGCAQLLSSLIDNILDAGVFNTRTQYTRMRKPFDPKSLCQRMVTIVEHIAHFSRLTFVVSEPQHVGIVLGDSDSLSQVLLNLLSNAIKVL